MNQILVTIIAIEQEEKHTYAIPDQTYCGKFHIPLQAPKDVKIGDRGIAVFDLSGWQFWPEGSHVWNGFTNRNPEAVRELEGVNG